MDRVQFDRRTFARQLARTTVGFVVLGTAAVACAGDDGGTEVAGTAGGVTPGSTPTGSGSSPSGATSTWRPVDLGFVAAYVLVRNGEAVIVDAGVEGSEDAIAQVLQQAGSGWSDVSDVILTHRHPDHVGSVPAVLAAATGATGWAGAEDIPSITSPRELSTANDGDVVAGLRIVGTPGHTAGHISVYDPAVRALVAGDALNGDGSGGLAGPNPQFTQDMDQAWASVAGIVEAGLDVAVIHPGHGGSVTADAGSKLAALVASR